MNNIRSVEARDIPELRTVIDSNDLFPSHLLNDMMSDYLQNPSSNDIWLTVESHRSVVGVAYCAPEKLTEGTYNLYLIAVHKRDHGKGVGSMLIRHLENLLRTQGHRILIVETSGLPDFELTRRFYEKTGYTSEARIRDFYKEGEDKIVFWKKLSDDEIVNF